MITIKEEDMFSYDENNHCYSLETKDLILSCEIVPDEELRKYGNLLIEKYNESIETVARYICRDSKFIEIYGEYTEGQMLEMIKKNMTIPWIFMKSSKTATIAYCDEDYVIEFEVRGCYEEFANLEISS